LEDKNFQQRSQNIRQTYM